jgi:hypothetical protein
MASSFAHQLYVTLHRHLSEDQLEAVLIELQAHANAASHDVIAAVMERHAEVKRKRPEQDQQQAASNPPQKPLALRAVAAAVRQMK